MQPPLPLATLPTLASSSKSWWPPPPPTPVSPGAQLWALARLTPPVDLEKEKVHLDLISRVLWTLKTRSESEAAGGALEKELFPWVAVPVGHLLSLIKTNGLLKVA